MNLEFSRKHFFISFGILSVGWLTINYLLFTSKGQIAFHSDFRSILDWTWEGKTDFIKSFGIYMPIIPYIVSVYGSFFNSYELLLANASIVKSFFILVDVISFAWVIALLPLKTIKGVLLLTMLTLLNLSLIYNSVFWGQVDSLHSLLVFSSFVALIKHRYKIVWILFTIAVLTKIVSVIFLPIIFLFMLNEVICNRLALKKVIIDLLFVPISGFVIFLPLILSGNVSAYVELTIKVLTEYDSVTSNAFNVYYLISNRTDLIEISSKELLFRSLSYNQFGFISFSVSFFICLLPVFKTIYRNYVSSKVTPISIKHLVLVFALTPLLFFFFTTKIRERFSHPYLVFLTLYCFYNRRFVFWYLATFIYFLQLESVLEYTRTYGTVFTSLLDKSNFYRPTFIASSFLILIIYLLHIQLTKKTIVVN